MNTFQTPRAVKLATSIASALALLAGCSPDTSNASGGKLPVRSIAGSSATPGIAGAFASGVAGGTASLPVTSNPAASSPIVGLAGAPAPTMPVAAPSGVAGAPAAPRPPVMPATPPLAQMPVVVTPNQKLPAVTDYAAPGPFPAREIDSTGPGGAYTMFRPTNLDANGFKFIPATWGNGITTTPQFYPWLTTVASHGFVIIAANTSTVTPDDMTKGLDWLIMQNDQAGDLQGKLDTSRAVCIGYSLGGGGAVTCGAHPKVITTIAMHPAPGLPNGLHGPLLLFSGTNDTVCVPETFVQPVFQGSPVPTFFGMLDGADHLEPVLGGRETAPFIAWLRLWVFGDEGAKPFFYGPDCTLCKAPWTKPQSKMLN